MITRRSRNTLLNVSSVAYYFFVLLATAQRQFLVEACLGGALPGACCSPNVPTCNNPCPQSYVAPHSYSSGGSSYSNDGGYGSSSNSYGGNEYGHGGHEYGGSQGGYGGGDYRPSNLDKHGNYGGYGNDGGYGGGSSYGKSNYGGGTEEYMSKSNYGNSGGYGGGYNSEASYKGSKSSYSEQPYAAPLPLPTYISSGYGQQSYVSNIPNAAPLLYLQQPNAGIPYSNALQPYTLAAVDQLYGNGGHQPSALTDGYVNIGEPSVYTIPSYPQGQRGPFAAARKAAGKKIVTVMTLSDKNSSNGTENDNTKPRRIKKSDSLKQL